MCFVSAEGDRERRKALPAGRSTKVRRLGKALANLGKPMANRCRTAQACPELVEG